MKTENSNSTFRFFRIDKQQLLDIFKPFLNLKYNDNNFSKIDHQYLIKLRYPTIDKQQLKAISDNTENDIFAHDILSPISANFQFDISLLQNYVKSTNNQHYLISYAFLISWLCLKSYSLDSEVLTLLYNLIIQVPSISEDTKTFFLKEIFSHYIHITNTPIELDLFLQIISNLNPYFLQLFVAEFLTAKDDSTKQLTLSYISSIKNDEFFIHNLSFLISALLPFIEKLDKFGLEFFAILINFRDVQSIIEIIQRFPQIIVNNIKSQFSFPSVQNFIFPIDGYLDYVFNFDSTETLPKGLIPLSISTFENRQNIELIATKDQLDVASNIVSFLSFLHLEFANLFLDSLANFVSNWNNDSLYLIFILIITKIEFPISKNIMNAILHPVVFSSGISLFFTEKAEFENNSFELILSIRKSIMEVFITKQKAMIPFLLESLNDSPLLFAETIGWIREKLPKCDLSGIIDEGTISLVMHQLSLLWYFCVREDVNTHDGQLNAEKSDTEKVPINKEEDDKLSDLHIYRSARSTIFLFIFYVLDDEELCVRCFSSATFTNSFLPRVLESTLQKLILNCLLKFLVLCKDKASMMPTYQMIHSIFKVCQSDKESLAHDLLNIINEASILNRSEIIFEPIISSVISFLNRYPSSSFLTSTLRLFTQISQNSDTFALNHLQIKQLSSAVRQIEVNDHSDETISAIIGLIGLSHSVTTSSMFLIKKPSLITLTFSILRSKNKLEEVLTFFSNLCKHSVFNICQCHRGELDFLLIEMMKNISKPFLFRGCEFDALCDLELMKNIGLPLIMSIVTVVCNNAVTTKLVRLISLNHELSVDILNSLNSSFSSLVKISTQILPINNSQEPTICVKNINGSLINQNFTIQVSLFVDNPYSIFLNRQYYLFRLTDDLHFSINYILNGESIICRVTTETDIYTCTLFKEFPKCQWCTFILSFIRNSDDTCSFSLLTKDFYSNEFYISCPDFRNSKMAFKVGYTDAINDDDSSEFQGFPCFIGRFALYPIEFTKEMSFATIVTGTQITDPSPIFSYPSPSQKYSNQLQVIENFKCRIKNILDVFTESQIFEFLPLFSPLDQMPEILLRVILSLISTVLNYSISLQSRFAFFPVIAKLLMESDPKRLTYSLYMRFFSIIGNCTEHHVISEIIKHILLNFELWIRAEASQLIRIAQHWGTSLYSACDQILNDSIGFDTLIAMVRMYFWFTPIETNLIRGVNERSPNLDINLCWQHIERLLSNYIKSKQSSNDVVNTLLSHCASCKDNQQVIRYFSILRTNCPNKNREFINEILFFFIKIKDNDIFIEALKTLYDFSDKDSIAKNIYSLLNTVQELKDNKFNNFTSSFDLKSLLDNLIQILPEYPLIYPLVILISSYCGNEHLINVSKLLGKLIPKSEYKNIIKDEFWMVYLFVLAIQIDKPDNLSVIYFICSIIIEEFSIELLMNVLAIIDFLDSIGGASLSEIRLEILKTVTDLNLTNSNKIKNELFIIGAKTLLLHYEKCSSSLKESFDSSPFNKLQEEDNNNDSLHIQITSNGDSTNVLKEFSNSLLVSDTNNSSLLVDSILNQPSNSNDISIISKPQGRKGRRSTFNRNSLRNQKEDELMRQVRSYRETSNKFEIKNIKSSKDLANLFSIDQSQIKRYYFGIHLSNDDRYHSLLMNICQLLSLSNNSNDNNDSSNQSSPSYLSPIVLKRVSQYLNLIQMKMEKNSFESNKIFILTRDNNFDESLRKFFSNTSLAWSMRVKSIVNKGREFFSSIKSNSLFPVSKVGIAFKGINHYANFLNNSLAHSNKMSFELERRFGDIIKLKEKRYYKHRFRFSSNFTQPKVSQFAKSSILRSVETSKRKRSSSFMPPSSSILYQCECNMIKIIKSRKTTFILTKENVVLERLKSIPISTLSFILRRRVLQRKTALEFITIEGHDILIDFAPYKSKEILKKILNFVRLPDSCMIQRVSARKFFNKINNFTEKWVKREITNFDYLMLMNIFGGRSFRDPSNYPIFPWIISNYDCSTFSLDDHSIYRNLYYPISAQDEERRKDLLQKFDLNLPISEDNLIYFNAPSNPTIVSYWMIHVEPFTSLHLDTEGGKFDLSARLFSSISSSAEQAKSNSSCWELTPEFYYKPEILLNLNNIEFKGKEENVKDEKQEFSNENERIQKIFDNKDNVVLPTWANKSPFELVYLLRKALESEYVSQNLDEWIDMMFGIASSGEAAKKQFNVFSPVLLSKIWKVNDSKSCTEDRKEFIETCLSKSGQIPETLFKMKHPKRNRISEPFEAEMNEKTKPKIEVLPLFSHNGENEDKIEFNNDKNSIKAAMILFESSNLIKIVYILGNGRIETYFVSVSMSSPASINLIPSDSITSSSTEVYNTNDFSSSENQGDSQTTEKREFVVIKDPNERSLNDVNGKCKYHSLESCMIVLNKDKLLYVTESSISSYSNSSISNSSISSLFESDLLICENCDSISIVNCEGVIYSSSIILPLASSSTSFLSFRSLSSLNLEESTSNEVLSLASISSPHSKMNLFTKSGKKTIEYELEFKQIGRAHCEKPLVIASSKIFDVLAVTSIEGNVNVYSLLTGIYECTCYTSDEPAENIIITPGWGFIVVSTIQDIYLFNINGFLIRKVQKTFNIIQWCTWMDEKGFDYVGIVKDDGSVVFCEAFFLNFSEPIQIIRELPVTMKYYAEINSLLIVTKHRKFVSVPLPK